MTRKEFDKILQEYIDIGASCEHKLPCVLCPSANCLSWVDSYADDLLYEMSREEIYAKLE